MRIGSQLYEFATFNKFEKITHNALLYLSSPNRTAPRSLRHSTIPTQYKYLQLPPPQHRTAKTYPYIHIRVISPNNAPPQLYTPIPTHYTALRTYAALDTRARDIDTPVFDSASLAELAFPALNYPERAYRYLLFFIYAHNNVRRQLVTARRRIFILWTK